MNTEQLVSVGKNIAKLADAIEKKQQEIENLRKQRDEDTSAVFGVGINYHHYGLGNVLGEGRAKLFTVIEEVLLQQLEDLQKDLEAATKALVAGTFEPERWGGWTPDGGDWYSNITYNYEFFQSWLGKRVEMLACWELNRQSYQFTKEILEKEDLVGYAGTSDFVAFKLIEE